MLDRKRRQTASPCSEAKRVGHGGESGRIIINADVPLELRYGFDPPDDTLELMLELAPDFANIFLRLDWMVLCAPPNKSFVTCDRPFSIVPSRDIKPSPFRGVGIATKGAWKLMPLSMSRCLVMADPGSVCAYTDCDMNGVRQSNLNICHGATRFVIGCERELVDSLVKEIQQVHAERGMKWGGSRLVVG